MFVHIVFMKFRKKEDILSAKEKLESLIDLVPSLVEIEVGVDVLHTNRSKDLVLITRFLSKADYHRYADHPKHLEVLAWLKQSLMESTTVDYIQGA